MTIHMRRLSVMAALVVSLGAAHEARAQVEIQNDFKYNSGQDVQPVFEGWSKTADGGFLMHFGYLNRNWAQQLSVPVGPDNSIEPGGPDRGQPTYFFTRTNRNLFTVPVPKDWGKKELVWTIVANGKSQRAVGWLQPEWEIDPAGGASLGGQQNEEARKNKAPAITIAPVASASVGASVKLTATVTDDGLPKPAPEKKAAIGQEIPAILQGGVDAPVNVPSVAAPARGAGPKIQGLSVAWSVWRGPANVVFDPILLPVKDGSAQTSAVFSKAGDYVLRARASDRLLTTDREIKITVQAVK